MCVRVERALVMFGFVAASEVAVLFDPNSLGLDAAKLTLILCYLLVMHQMLCFDLLKTSNASIDRWLI